MNKHTFYKKKNKRQRQDWWKSLGDDERGAYIKRVVGRKMEKRRQQDEREAVVDSERNCENCFHGITNSCQGLIDTGRRCKDWWHPDYE